MADVPTVPFWNDVPEAWDTVQFVSATETITLPGTCSLVPSRAQGVDRKKGSGAAGETLTFQGGKNADGAITCSIHTREHLAAMNTILPKIEPYGGEKNGRPFRIVNAAAAQRGITDIVIVKIDGPAKQGDRRVYTIQYIEVRKVTGAATGSAKGGGKLSQCEKLAAEYKNVVKALAIADTPEKFVALINRSNEIMGLQAISGCFGPGKGAPPNAQPGGADPT